MVRRQNVVAGYSHQKKTDKKTKRILLAILFWVIPATVFVLLAHFAFFQRPSLASAADESTPEPALDLEAGSQTPLPAADPTPVQTPEATPEPTAALWNQGAKELPTDQAPGEDVPEYLFFTAAGDRLVNYTWGDPVPESEAVEDEFFSDTAFIGNSLAQGFMLYAGMKTPDYYATQSISVANIYYEKAINAGGGVYITILDAMSRKSHSKVYIMLGLNEISMQEDEFVEKYGRLIDRIREIQPGAAVYLQSMTPVTAAQSESGSVFNNKRIRRYNELIREIAADKKAHYLDVYSSIADENGDLPAGGSFDGIHPYTKYYKSWKEYLKTHTVLEEKQ